MVSLWRTLRPQVIVVDNNSSTDDIARLSESELDFQLVRKSSNQGYGGGNNTAIMKAVEDHCQYILLLNTDTLASEECISLLMKCLDNNPDIAIIGPLLNERGKLFAGGRNIGLYADTRVPYRKRQEYRSLIPADYVPGTVLLARKSTFDRAGILNEEYFFSGEVADFCRRVRSLGMRCVVFSGCTASHKQRMRSKNMEALYNYYSIRNRFLFVRRLYPHLKVVLVPRWILGGSLQVFLAVLTGRKELARALRKGVCDGLAGRYGNRNELFRI
jgi:GT2 family glycosyltransferase